MRREYFADELFESAASKLSPERQRFDDLIWEIDPKILAHDAPP